MLYLKSCLVIASYKSQICLNHIYICTHTTRAAAHHVHGNSSFKLSLVHTAAAAKVVGNTFHVYRRSLYASSQSHRIQCQSNSCRKVHLPANYRKTKRTHFFSCWPYARILHWSHKVSHKFWKPG